MNSDSTGVHPWVSDGTAAGTHMLVDLNPGGSADVRWFADLNGETYIASNDSTNGARIWRTDGTTAGTVVVGSSALPPLEGAVQVSGQKLFFAASDGAVGLELNVVENDAPVQAAPPPPPGGGGGGGGAGGGGGGTVGLLDLLALAGLVGLRKRRLLQ